MPFLSPSLSRKLLAAGLSSHFLKSEIDPEEFLRSLKTPPPMVQFIILSGLPLSLILGLHLNQLRGSTLYLEGCQYHLSPRLASLLYQEIRDRPLLAHDSPCLFVNGNGRPITPKNLWPMWRRWLKDQGIPHISLKEFRTHNPLHSFSEKV